MNQHRPNRRNCRRAACVLLVVTFAVGNSSIALAESHISTSDVLAIDGSGVTGSSTVVRTKNGISFSLATSGWGIHPGHAVTVWVVVFNEPGNCIVPNACGGDDIFVSPGPPETEIFFGAGNIVGGSGTIHFAGRVGVNDVGHFAGFPNDPGSGFKDPMTAEVHLIGRGHGPMVPAEMPAMINSYAGGCVDFLGPPGPAEDPDELGECADVQFSIHSAAP